MTKMMHAKMSTTTTSTTASVLGVGMLLLWLSPQHLVSSFRISSVKRATTTWHSLEPSRRPLPSSYSYSSPVPSWYDSSAPWQLHASAISSEASDSRSTSTNSDAPSTSSSSSINNSNNNNVNILSFDWKSVVDHVWESSDRPIVLFDGHCNLCNSAVCFCLDWDTSNQFRFASLQSKVGQSLLVQTGRSPYDLSSIVLVTSPNKSFRESDAVLRICQKLQGSPVWPVLGVVGLAFPRFMRDAAYKVVAKNRHRFVEEMCRLDLDGEYHDRFVHDDEHVPSTDATTTTTTTTTK